MDKISVEIVMMTFPSYFIITLRIKEIRTEIHVVYLCRFCVKFIFVIFIRIVFHLYNMKLFFFLQGIYIIRFGKKSSYDISGNFFVFRNLYSGITVSLYCICNFTDETGVSLNYLQLYLTIVAK